MEPYPPLGTIYAAAVLRNAGHLVTFHDNVFCTSTEEVNNKIAQHTGSYFVIYDDGFNYLTKMCLVNMRNACFEMIRSAKAHHCTVIVSSSDATDHREAYLQAGADAIIIGEAETTLQELLSTEKKDWQAISGIAFFDQDKLRQTSPRPVITDLDQLPLPAWDLIDIAAYRSKWKNQTGYFSLNITTTRGCPFKCNWCAKPIYGNRYNARSPEQVVAEIRMLKEQYAVDHIWFCDDIFGLKPGWIKRFADLIQSNQIKIAFKIQCRADLLLDENNIADLARAGCDEAWIGAESGSQKILDAMDKGTTVEQIYQSAALMRKHNIKPCFFLQFGYPGEEKKDIQATLDMVHNCKPYDIGISVSYPLPGTKFYETVRDQLKTKQNWNDSDELLLMYKGTYSDAYYKRLHRYVHKRFRAMQGWKGLLGQFGARTDYWPMPMRRVIAMPYNLVAAAVYKITL